LVRERAAAIRELARGHVVAGSQHRGAELARGSEQIVELDQLVAIDARHRRLAGDVALCKPVDHRFLEPALVVEHVVRNADALGDRARVIDVLAGAAGALAMGGSTVVIELQGNADDVVAFGLDQRGGDRGIDPPGHRDDDAGFLRTALDFERVKHRLTIGADGGRGKDLGTDRRYPLRQILSRKP
jgi:hypothetical protein